MQPLQRMFGVLLGVVLIVLLPAWEEKWQMEKREKEWKEVLLERFCEELCTTGSCTVESYMRYQEALGQGTKVYGLKLTEYQRAEDRNADIHWYCVFGDEIEEKLLKEGYYSFADGAAIRLSAVAEDGESIACGGRIKRKRG